MTQTNQQPEAPAKREFSLSAGVSLLGGETMNPRIQFNGGYQDARFDRNNDRVRAVVDSGSQTVQQVSRSYSQHYAAGYECGLSSDSEHRSSETAWARYAGGRTLDQFKVLFAEQLAPEVAELAHCLKAPREDRYVTERARMYTERVFASVAT